MPARRAPPRLHHLLLHLSAPAPTTAAAASSEKQGDGQQQQLRVAVTGTSVGIGLEFVRQYASAGARVYALCRTPAAATDLAALATGSAWCCQSLADTLHVSLDLPRHRI